jgi:hypothetical protein
MEGLRVNPASREKMRALFTLQIQVHHTLLAWQFKLHNLNRAILVGTLYKPMGRGVGILCSKGAFPIRCLCLEKESF